MRAIRNKETRPEREVRSILHNLGYRFRKNVTKLPGRPDVVFPSRKKAIFVHGCFWHHHSCRKNSALPRTRAEYWLNKLKRTAKRDSQNIYALRAEGWKSKVIWECEMKQPEAVRRKLTKFLGRVGQAEKRKLTKG